MVEAAGAAAGAGDGTAGAAGAGAAGAGAAGDAAGGGGDWSAGLSADVRGALAPKNFGGVDALGRAYMELEKTVGVPKLAIPNEKSTPEDWGKVWDALGRPEKADGYDLKDFKPPEGLPWNGDLQTRLVGKMHDLGLNGGQVRGLMDEYAAGQGEAFKALETSAAETTAKHKAHLEAKWGNAFQERAGGAHEFAQAAFGDNHDEALKLQLMDGSFLLDNPLIVEAFSIAAEAVREGGLLPDMPSGGQRFSMTPAQAKAELTRLKNDPGEAEFRKAFLNNKHAEHEAAVQKMQRLSATAKA